MLALVLFVGLSLVGVGCGGAGSNQGGGSDNGDGDGDGDGDDTVVPAAPSGLAADASDGSVELTWESVADAESYNVYRASESGFEPSDPLADGQSRTSYTDAGAENGTTYYYVVTAVADEEGDPSGEVESTPFAAPSGLEGTSGDAQIKLEWSGGEGAESYAVYRDTESMDGATGDPLESGVSGTSYTDESAENGTKYYYRVTSVNPEDEESSSSNEVGKTPFSDPPDRPE